MLSTRTLGISIACEPARVYEYIRDPRNLPQWAPAFCKSVRREGDDWVVETPHGPVGLRFSPRNALGVLDHYLRPTPDAEFYVPLRVVPNHGGSEVLFTLFRLPDVSDERFDEDINLVQQDLGTLKRILEA